MEKYDIAEVVTEITEKITPDRYLHKTQKEVVDDLVKATSKEELKKQIELFDLNQSKKNALRILKLEDALNKVEDQIIERFDKRPDQLSNRDLLDFLTTISGQIEKSQKVVDSVEERELAKQIVTNTFEPKSSTQYNINLGTDLNKDNKENVVSAIQDILSLLQANTTENIEEKPEEIQEVEVVEEN